MTYDKFTRTPTRRSSEVGGFLLHVFGDTRADLGCGIDGNCIATLTPVMMQDCHKKMKDGQFEGTAICPFVQGGPSKPLAVTFTTEEKKFKTKITKVSLKMPRAVWMEYKAYKVRM